MRIRFIIVIFRKFEMKWVGRNIFPNPFDDIVGSTFKKESGGADFFEKKLNDYLYIVSSPFFTVEKNCKAAKVARYVRRCSGGSQFNIGVP